MENWFKFWFDNNYLNLYLFKQSEDLTRIQVDFIIETLSLKPIHNILDLGCGIGRHLIEFGKRGYSGIGIDINQDFIDIANEKKENLKNVKFIKMDLRELSFYDEFDVAISLWTSFGYFTDEENLNVLKKINKALKAHGKLLIDIENIYYLINNLPKERWEEVDKEIFILERNNLNINKSRLKTERVILKGENIYRYIRDYRIYTLNEIEIYLKNSGFKLLNFYGGYDKENLNLFSKRLIVIAEKS